MSHSEHSLRLGVVVDFIPNNPVTHFPSLSHYWVCFSNTCWSAVSVELAGVGGMGSSLGEYLIC